MSLPPLPPDDDVVSAYLDGEATPAERALVEADPVLVARVERYRRMGDAVRAPAVPDPVRREEAIAAALGVLAGTVVPFPPSDERAALGASAALPPSTAVPTSAAAAPAPGRTPQAPPRNARGSRWLVLAAAAVVVVVVAVAGVVATSDDGSDDLATPGTEQPGPGTTATSGNPDFPPVGSISTAPPAVGSGDVDLGSFTDTDELIGAVGERPEAGEPAPGRTLSHPCRPIGAQAAYTATVAGDDVVVFLAADPETRLLTEGSIYTTTCTEVETFSLA